MPHVLIICTANICRSPVGEAVLRQLLDRQDLSDWTVGSAGTWAQVERSAAHFSQELMAERGLDIRSHRSRMVEDGHLAEADLVLCMTSSHAEALRTEFPQYAGKIYLLSEMVDQHYDIVDPYGGPREEYRRMVADVSELLEEGLPRIIRLAAEDGRAAETAD